MVFVAVNLWPEMTAEQGTNYFSAWVEKVAHNRDLQSMCKTVINQFI